MKKFFLILFSFLKQKSSFLFFALSFALFLSPFLFPFLLKADTYTDNSNDAAGFGGGTHSDSQWDGVNMWIEMDATGQTNGFATFTSRILNAGSNARWDSIAWVPQRPLLKELPDSMATETAYSEGNIGMGNAKVLLHFNETSGATNFVDSSGNGNTGSCIDCPTVSANGRFNNAFSFDGNNDTVQLPSQPVSSLIGDTFTISFWVNPGAADDRPTFGFTGAGGANSLNPIASYDGGLSIGNGGSSQILSALPDAPANTWTHYVIVDDGTNYVRYVNGSRVATNAVSTDPASGANRIFTIGQSGFDGGFENYFNGRFDEFVILNRGLSPTEVLDMYRRGAQRIKFQIRSCDDNSCSGESFVGPDGLTTSFYTETTTSTITLPSKIITSMSRNQYFQYRAILETSSSTLNAELKSVTLANTGAGVAGVTVTQSGGTTAIVEGGATDSYTLVLDAQTIDDTTISVSPNSECTVSTSTIVFTSSTWSNAVTVTVTPTNDSVAEGTHTCVITHTSASSDTDYNGIAISSVSATVTDNDTAGVTITESAASTVLTEAGATDSYTVILTSQPTSTVTVALSLSDNSQASLSTSSIVFTDSNWDDAVTVTLTATDDTVAEGTHAVNVSHIVTSGNWNYNGISVSAVVASLTDNDSAGVTITESDGTTSVTEAGGTDSYTVVLTSSPTSTVVIAITGTADITLSTSSLEFSSGNWNIPVTVTVSGVDDTTVEGSETSSVSHSATSNNWNYNGIAVNSVSVGITDNDVASSSSGGNNNAAPAASPAPVPIFQNETEVHPSRLATPPLVVPLRLSVDTPATFSVGTQSHSMTQVGVATDAQITVLVQSDPIVVVLQKQKPQDLDLDNDKKIDVQLLYLGKKNGIPEIETKIFGQPDPKRLPFSVNEGASTTSIQDVMLYFQVKNVSWMAISENKNFASASFIPFQNQYAWKLSNGFGQKTLYVRLRSSSGGMIDLNDSIVYESKVSVPTPPLQSSSKRNKSSIVFSRFLKKGMVGEDVRELQSILQNLGFMNKASTTNFYGVLTEQAVKKFQKSVGLDSFGYVGPGTRKALNAIK